MAQHCDRDNFLSDVRLEPILYFEFLGHLLTFHCHYAGQSCSHRLQRTFTSSDLVCPRGTDLVSLAARLCQFYVTTHSIHVVPLTILTCCQIIFFADPQQQGLRKEQGTCPSHAGAPSAEVAAQVSIQEEYLQSEPGFLCRVHLMLSFIIFLQHLLSSSSTSRHDSLNQTKMMPIYCAEQACRLPVQQPQSLI